MFKKALFVAFLMVNSNLICPNWRKFYPRKTLEKGVKKGSFSPILIVKINIIQKTVCLSKIYFLDLSDAVFKIKKNSPWLKRNLENIKKKYILRSQS